MILSRPVNARARRMHDIVASVPLLTIRTFSIDGTQSQINSAISTSSGFGIPKLNPRVAAPRTASITTFGAWPRIAGRSEEHTSELQSHHDLVCRLLLEKKKKNKKIYYYSR